MVPGALVLERMHHAVIPDPVLVGFTDCTEARVEAFGHGLDFGDAYRLRQVGVECHAPGFRSEAFCDPVDGSGLTRGMDSCVGPTGAMNGDRLVEEGEERLFESVLHAATFGLVLPTAEPSAVVLDGQFEDGSGAHGHRGLSGSVQWRRGKEGLAIEPALEDLLCGDLVDEGLGLLCRFACVLEHAMCSDGGQAFIDKPDGDGSTLERFAQSIGELFHFFGRFTGRAVHVFWEAEDDGIRFLFGEQSDDALDGRGILRERLRGAVRDGLEGVREHAEFVGHSDADACVAVINPEGAVHRGGGGVKEKADRFGVRLFGF